MVIDPWMPPSRIAARMVRIFHWPPGIDSWLRRPPTQRAYSVVIARDTPLSSRKIRRSCGSVRTRSTNSWRVWRLASVSRSVAWTDFFPPQIQPLQYVAYLGDAQPHPALFGQDVLQLRQCPVGTIFDRFKESGLNWSIHEAERPMPLLDPLRLPALPLLPEDLLHPAQAYPKPVRQLTLRALAPCMRCQYFPSQIVVVGSRHTLRGYSKSAL